MKRLVSWLLWCWLLMVSLAQAADYQLTLGQGIDVCEACKQNLERMTVHPACEREYSAQFDLEPAAWKPFDVAGHLEAMEQVLYFLASGSESVGNALLDDSRFEDAIRRISTKEEPWAYGLLSRFSSRNVCSIGRIFERRENAKSGLDARAEMISKLIESKLDFTFF